VKTTRWVWLLPEVAPAERVSSHASILNTVILLLEMSQLTLQQLREELSCFAGEVLEREMSNCCCRLDDVHATVKLLKDDVSRLLTVEAALSSPMVGTETSVRSIDSDAHALLQRTSVLNTRKPKETEKGNSEGLGRWTVPRVSSRGLPWPGGPVTASSPRHSSQAGCGRRSFDSSFPNNGKSAHGMPKGGPHIQINHCPTVATKPGNMTGGSPVAAEEPAPSECAQGRSRARVSISEEAFVCPGELSTTLPSGTPTGPSPWNSSSMCTDDLAILPNEVPLELVGELGLPQGSLPARANGIALADETPLTLLSTGPEPAPPPEEDIAAPMLKSVPLSENSCSAAGSVDDMPFLRRHRRGYLSSQEAIVKQDSIHTNRANYPWRGGRRDSDANVVPTPSMGQNICPDDNFEVSMCDDGVFVSDDRWLVRRIVESSYFDYVSALLILVNAVSLGVQTDYMARNLTAEEPLVFRIVEKIFCFLFTSELAMRLCVHRFSFFTMQGWRWNLFDILIVGMQLAEEVAQIAALTSASEDSGQSDVDDNVQDKSGTANFSALRVIRVLRLVRIVRLARVMHLISELRTIVVSIFSSLRPLFWTLVLLLIIIYIIAVYITQVVTDHLISDVDATSDGTGNLKRLYGSVSRSILSLFQYISGGINWDIGLDPLMVYISPLIGLLFAAYVGFSIFALMNITTGVFVESALKNANKDQELFLMYHAKDLFAALDLDESGDITWQEFSASLDTPAMRLYFKTIDLDPSEAQDLFRIIDFDGKGFVDINQFIWGCIRLRGPARSLDLAALIQAYVRTSDKFKTSLDRILRTTRLLCARVEQMRFTHDTGANPSHGR